MPFIIHPQLPYLTNFGCIQARKYNSSVNMFNSKKMAIKDKTTKTLYVDSNDEVNPRIAVKVTGKVIPGDGPHLVVRPDPLLLDPENPGYPEARLELLNRGGRHLEIIEIRCFFVAEET